MEKSFFFNPYQSAQKSLMPFTVIGDPNFQTSLKIVQTFVENGADFLELGLPFSDPPADGPIIQTAMKRALKTGMNTDLAFKFVQKIRLFTSIPIGFLVYYNLVFQYGPESFYQKMKETGVNSILIADLPLEEAKEVLKLSRKYQIHQIFIVSPLTNQKRLKQILKKASGFLYLVSHLGTTGTQKNLQKETQRTLKCLRPQTNLPLFVGFGISKPEHIKKLYQTGADCAIIGSALVQIIGKNLKNPARMLSEIKTFLSKLKA